MRKNPSVFNALGFFLWAFFKLITSLFTSHLDEAYFLTEYKRYTHIICIFQAVALSFSNVPQSIGAVLLVQDDLINRSIQIIT